MKARSAITLVVIVALFAALVITAAAQGVSSDGASAAGDASTSHAVWGNYWLVAGNGMNDVGQHVSGTVDASDGRLYASYYDATNDALRLAGHNLSSGSFWFSNVDDTGNVGQYSSIAVYSSTSSTDWKVGIAYYDATNGDLKYAENTAWGGYSWAISTVDTGNPIFVYDGRYTSLVFDSSGTPHVSYYTRVALGDDGLKYAHYIGSGGNCGSGAAAGKWQCDVIDSGDRVGTYTSIDLYGVNERPHIAYHDAGGDKLKYAVYNPAYTFGCSTGISGWSCFEIDSSVAGPVSADADPASGDMHIAYVTAGDELYYAVPVSSGGNCGPSNSWRCREIEDVGTSADARGVSLVIDDGGYPVIAYQDISSGSIESLKVARPGAALGLQLGASQLNCAPAAFINTWNCETVYAGSANQYVGDYVAVAVSPAGLLRVWYYVQSIAPDAGYLYLRYQWYQVFLPLVIKE